MQIKNILVPSFVLLVLICTPAESFAVGGISNSKVIVPSTDTVPKKKIEIEPFASFLFADDENNTKTYDLGMRATYGLLDTVEFGASFFFVTFEDDDLINTDASFGNIEPGVKWRFLEQEDYSLTSFSLAYEGGLTLPTSGSNELWAFEPLGLILTKNINEQLSIDHDAVLRIVEDELWGIITNHGIGYYITDWFQPVGEIGYVYENTDNSRNAHVLSVTGGFTADLTEYATLIVGVTKDIVSEDTEDTLVITSALTLIF